MGPLPAFLPAFLLASVPTATPPLASAAAAPPSAVPALAGAAAAAAAAAEAFLPRAAGAVALPAPARDGGPEQHKTCALVQREGKMKGSRSRVVDRKHASGIRSLGGDPRPWLMLPQTVSLPFWELEHRPPSQGRCRCRQRRAGPELGTAGARRSRSSVTRRAQKLVGVKFRESIKITKKITADKTARVGGKIYSCVRGSVRRNRATDGTALTLYDLSMLRIHSGSCSSPAASGGTNPRPMGRSSSSLSALALANARLRRRGAAGDAMSCSL